MEAYAHGLIAECAIPFGLYGYAYREALAGLEIARELGHKEWLMLALAALGPVHAHCGDLGAARRFHTEMLITARDLGTAPWIADALGNLGFVLMQEGDHEAAEAHFAEAVQVGGEGTKHVVRPLVAQAELALKRARRTRSIWHKSFSPRRRAWVASSTLNRAASLVRPWPGSGALRKRSRFCVRWRASLALAQILRTSGDEVAAAAEIREARDLLEATAADQTDPVLRQSFERTGSMREACAMSSGA
jgi:tetratricopeptide (TPR) repeat protein